MSAPKASILHNQACIAFNLVRSFSYLDILMASWVAKSDVAGSTHKMTFDSPALPGEAR